ncbi:hypothetical protein ACE6H2_010776 [Prunus campanulata]
MAFSGLEAEEDMRGRRLRTNGRRSQTDSSADNMTRGVGHERRRRWESPRHREERESWSGDRRDRGRYNNWTGYNTASWEASSKSGALADRIRRTREGEERERRIREEAWNAGMLGRRDEQPLPDESSENVLQEFVYAGPQAQGRNASDLEETVIVSAENGEAIDLNVAIMEGVGGGVEGIEGLEREVSVQNEADRQDEQVHFASLTQGSDPFNLGPLIQQLGHQKKTQYCSGRGKRARDEFPSLKSP